MEYDVDKLTTTSISHTDLTSGPSPDRQLPLPCYVSIMGIRSPGDAALLSRRDAIVTRGTDDLEDTDLWVLLEHGVSGLTVLDINPSDATVNPGDGVSRRYDPNHRLNILGFLVR
ncbi:uncharacterized protein BCR38DRAFT_148783 [Pseudomassariella vexata]|uniref:Uncharacterized protein n=1 Tax=Pseudomassariella vexata TaxID=1141098 RepID=A0A1Y2E6B0_9PEZI|nr:uncharacterized protein BCR38DRAFT_148783 [Pseudomassariella vexata]ORY66977.1 hypothetical protein BCR38DRAFT_148783 [Pseudomassariella vexata]